VLVTVSVGGTLEPGYADLTPPLIAVTAVVYWVFVGIGEELVARAYVQNKLVALLGGGRSRGRKALGIALAAAVFALWHVPQRLVVADLEPAELPGNLLVLFVVALAFGLVYELTRNVVFTGLVHGALDFPPIAVSVFYDGGATWVQALLLVAIVAPFLLGTWAYRRWARNHRETDFRPQVAV
jgi:membrane protease YdiL (CAAX protease family)